MTILFWFCVVMGFLDLLIHAVGGMSHKESERHAYEAALFFLLALCLK